MTPVAGLLLLVASSAFAQTPAAKPAVSHHSTAAKASTPALVTNPPGAPKVVGLPKTLYSLRYIDTLIGKGDLAVPRKFYTVHYTGWLADGTKFDSSVDRNQPFTFPYGAHRVIPGWDTGFEGMRIGGKRRLFVPYQLAYGEQSVGKIPSKSNLIFDVELLGMSDAPPPPPPAPVRPAEPAEKPDEPATSAPKGDAPASTAPASPSDAPKPATPPPPPSPQ